MADVMAITKWNQGDELVLGPLTGKSPGYCNLFRRFW